MKPLRRYQKATIYFRDCNETDGEYFDVCIYSSVLIFFDSKGHERTVPMVFVKEVIEYVEDRIKPTEQPQAEQPMADQGNILVQGPPINVGHPAQPPIVRKIQSPRSGKAYHV